MGLILSRKDETGPERLRTDPSGCTSEQGAAGLEAQKV